MILHARLKQITKENDMRKRKKAESVWVSVFGGIGLGIGVYVVMLLVSYLWGLA